MYSLWSYMFEREDKGTVELEKQANESGTKRNIVNAIEIKIDCRKLIDSDLIQELRDRVQEETTKEVWIRKEINVQRDSGL